MLSRFVIAFLSRSKCRLISWKQSLSTVILEPKEIKSVIVSIFPHLFAMKWWSHMPWSSFFEYWVLSQLFHSPLSPSSGGFLVILHFVHKGGVICISEVIDISPGNLDSSLCFIQQCISQDVLCIDIKQAGWKYITFTYSFPNFEPIHCSMSSSNHCFLTSIQVSQEAGKVSGIPISWRIFHSLLWST